VNLIRIAPARWLSKRPARRLDPLQLPAALAGIPWDPSARPWQVSARELYV